MSEKQKLTLSVRKDVIDKAKELGINISEITEKVLQGFAFSSEDLSDDEFYSKYEELFQVMLPLMRKYDFSVEFAKLVIFDKEGDVLAEEGIYLLPDGRFWESFTEDCLKSTDIRSINTYDLHPPVIILSKFIESLTNSIEKRKERIKELEMAKQIIEAISKTLK